MLNLIVPEFIYQLKNNDNLWKLFDNFISSFQVNVIKKRNVIKKNVLCYHLLCFNLQKNNELI